MKKGARGKKAAAKQMGKSLKTVIHKMGEQMENRIKETQNGIVVTPDQASIAVVASYVEETLENYEVAMKDSYKINIALDELYSNIVRYSGASKARVSCVVDEHAVILYLQDNGIPFDPTAKEDADMEQLAEEEQIGGRGIFLVKKLMSEVTYCYQNGYNELTVKLQRQ